MVSKSENSQSYSKTVCRHLKGKFLHHGRLCSIWCWVGGDAIIQFRLWKLFDRMQKFGGDSLLPTLCFHTWIQSLSCFLFYTKSDLILTFVPVWLLPQLLGAWGPGGDRAYRWYQATWLLHPPAVWWKGNVQNATPFQPARCGFTVQLQTHIWEPTSH